MFVPVCAAVFKDLFWDQIMISTYEFAWKCLWMESVSWVQILIEAVYFHFTLVLIGGGEAYIHFLILALGKIE